MLLRFSNIGYVRCQGQKYHADKKVLQERGKKIFPLKSWLTGDKGLQGRKYSLCTALPASSLPSRHSDISSWLLPAPVPHFCLGSCPGLSLSQSQQFHMPMSCPGSCASVTHICVVTCALFRTVTVC